MDCSLPGSSVHGIFQARILEWIAISFSRGSSQPRDRTWVSHIIGRCFTIWATRALDEILSDNLKERGPFFLVLHTISQASLVVFGYSDSDLIHRQDVPVSCLTTVWNLFSCITEERNNMHSQEPCPRGQLPSHIALRKGAEVFSHPCPGSVFWFSKSMKDKSFNASVSQASLCLCPPTSRHDFSGWDALSLEGPQVVAKWPSGRLCLQGSPLATFITPLILSLARIYFILIFISTLTEDLSLRGGITLVKLIRPIYKIRYQVSNLQRGITNARTENFEVHINSVFFFFFGCQMILYFSFFFAVLN